MFHVKHVERAGDPPAAQRLFGDHFDRAARYAELLGTVGVERGLIGPREVGPALGSACAEQRRG